MPSNTVNMMIVEAAHRSCQHYGVGYVVANLRHKYWFPRLRQVVKRVQYRCITCKRLQGKRYAEVPVPPLPDVRIQWTAPFQVTGVDYTGAINVKGIKGEVGKMYIIVFTYAITSAVHLEVVNNFTCDSFLHTFRRFNSRRGYPQILLRDNATTFQSTVRFNGG